MFGSGIIVDTGIVKSITFADSATDATDASVYTFTSIGVGTANSNRFVVAALSFSDDTGHADGYGPTSVTIGGVTATEILSSSRNDKRGTEELGVSLWYAPLPTGTTANIVATYPDTLNNCACATWALISDTGAATQAIDTGGDIMTQKSLTLSPSGATIGIVCIMVKTAASSPSVTWTGGSTETEEFDSVIETYYAFAGVTLTGLGTTTANFSTSDIVNMVAASW